MRASPGQKVLNLETVNAADGATLTQPQAIRRWVFLWGPHRARSALIATILGILISLLAWPALPDLPDVHDSTRAPSARATTTCRQARWS